MSTQTDFIALVVRIDAATDRLEMDVMELERLINDAEGAVSEELTQLVAQATASANAAQMSAQTATQAANSASISNNNAAIEANRAAAQVILAQAEVTKAIAQVQLAKDEVVKATTQADRAKTEADRAQTIATNLLDTAPFDEAPINGNTYGRKNGEWSVVGSGSGGSGTVISVNGVEPDTEGNVQLSIPTNTNQLTNGSGFITAADIPVVDVPTKTSELTNDSGFITAADVPAQPTKVSELQNDTGFITLAEVPTVTVPTKTSQLTNDSAFITLADVPASPISTDAPADGKQYARQDNAWSEVVASGGGQVPFIYSTAAMLGINPASAKVCFNYALYEAIQTKGAYYWNDAATINAVNTDAHWMTEATYNPLGANAGGVALDIRYFRVYSLNPTTGAVLGHSGATWSGTAWVPANAFLGIVGQIIGQYSDGIISASTIVNFLPVGKWFYPNIIQDYTNGNQKALPTAQIRVNHALVTKTVMMYGGSANYPYGNYNSLDLLWLTNAAVASKGQYYLQRSTDTWINTGLGTQ